MARLPRGRTATWVALVLSALICRFVNSDEYSEVRAEEAAAVNSADPNEGSATLFREQITPILERRCLSCHNDQDPKGGLSLSQRDSALRGGDSGEVIFPGDVDSSYLIDLVTPREGQAEMPKGADPLSSEEVDILRRWIAADAEWPDTDRLDVAQVRDTDWWSLQPLRRPEVPNIHSIAREHAEWVRTPVDAFVLEKMLEQGLTPSPTADRVTLIRRLYFDLLGLPPTPEEIANFVHDPDDRAYERLIDRLLESPHYGERWARHWLDVVHYGDTHGYDKDKPRPHAWPYRDYVIRSFNADKPYGQFVREQIAGDVLLPHHPDGIVATGFIAAGPWDFISHVEVPESKLDGQIARSLDRDDMVRTTMETFNSVTIGCARCHHHKFDPITQEDYYSLQAVFAAVDRADRPYDAEMTVAERRRSLARQRRQNQEARQRLQEVVEASVGKRLADLDDQIGQLRNEATAERPEFGYHSQIAAEQETTKWVQVDLGNTVSIGEIIYVACHDDFNNIGAGFGFPLRYRIELSDDPDFRAGVQIVTDQTSDDVPNPGVSPQRRQLSGQLARYVRFTATKLAPRQNDYILALAELMVLGADGENLAFGAPVTALDSIEAPVRWRKQNLVDGYYVGMAADPRSAERLEELQKRRDALVNSALTPEQQAEWIRLESQSSELEAEWGTLPEPRMVFAANTDFSPQGNFRATGGQPREIRVLHRGNVSQPGDLVTPGTLRAIDHLPSRFELGEEHHEGERRAALAHWLTDLEHPLTWRSMANRIWLYHFGQAIVDSPNDFGRMGELPTHPELLDWLASELRDGKQSVKRLHRLVCNSATYRQASAERPECVEADRGNQWLWRMNRRRLEAEAVRDTVLEIAGKLDRTQFGPGFQDFVIEKPEHSPHYRYELHDPEDPQSHRRAIYRYVVRSQQQPFMTTLDCADPSMQVEKRNETVTALQALVMLNNPFMLAMAGHFAERVSQEERDISSQVDRAFQLAIGRQPDEAEQKAMAAYAGQHGLRNLCRLIMNLNEFVFVD